MTIQERLEAAKREVKPSTMVTNDITARIARAKGETLSTPSTPQTASAPKLIKGAMATPSTSTTTRSSGEIYDEIKALNRKINQSYEPNPADQARMAQLEAEYASTVKPTTIGDFVKDNLYTTEREAAGALGGVEDAVKGFSATIYSALSKGLSGNRFQGEQVKQQLAPTVPNPLTPKLQQAADKILESQNISEQYKGNIDSRYSPSAQLQSMGDITESIGRMVPTIAANATGGAAAGKLAIGLQASGSSARQAKAEGATAEQAIAYGLSSGALETGIESIAGGIPGLPKGAVSNLIKKISSSPVANKLIDVLGEGGEGALSAFLTPYLQRAIYNPEAKNATAEEISDAAFAGIATSAIMQGAEGVARLGSKLTIPQLKPKAQTTTTQPQLTQDSTNATNPIKDMAKLNVPQIATQGTTQDVVGKQQNAVEKSQDVVATLPEGMGAASTGFDPYTQKVNEYGAIPEGENPARVVDVPKQVDPDRLVSQTVRTIEEAEATPDTLIPKIEQATLDGMFSYKVKTDKAALDNANSTVSYKGYKNALQDWTADVRSGKVSKDLSALGWTLYNNAANIGDAETAVNILTDLVSMHRLGAQATQAVRLLKKMSPEHQLYSVQRSLSHIVDELKQKYGDKAKAVEIDQDLEAEFLKAKDQAERDKILSQIHKNIASQIPSTFADKFNHWRYMAMLFNPRTHIKNIAGNIGFVAPRAVKNTLAKGMETVFIGKKEGRTQAFLTPKDSTLVRAAYADYTNVADQITEYGKYDDPKNKIEKERTIFKTKALETTRKVNAAALDKEDVWFSQPAYARALASYMKANNMSVDDLKYNNATTEMARQHAVTEARRATYRDSNAFSDWVSSLGRNYSGNSGWKKAANIAVEGILPFKRTPANILVRGVEYSPIGLIKGLTSDLYQVRKGDMQASEAIDNIAAGITGTGLVGFGLWLASMGLISGGGSDDDKEKSFAELQGHQDFALQIGDVSYTLDWLSPAAMPLFVGVEIWNRATDKSEGGVTLNDMLESVGRIANPVLETSMLQSIDKVLQGISYSDSPIAYLVSEAAVSYLGQVVPTLFGQISRTIDPIRRTTYTDKNSGIPSNAQYFAQKNAIKIPGLSTTAQPYIDEWGRVEKVDNTLQRAAQNFISPGYVSKLGTSDMEKELQRLYDQTGMKEVLPSRASKYVTSNGTRYDMTAEEYTKFATTKGQTAHDMLTELTKSKEYNALTDDGKASVVKDVYDYASGVAKEELLDSRKAKYESDSLVAELKGADKLKITASQYLITKQAFKDPAPTETKTSAQLKVQNLTKDLSATARAYVSKTKTEETGNDLARMILFDRKDLTPKQKSYLDTALVGKLKNPIDYTSQDTFHLSQLSEPQQEKWETVKQRLGISAKEYSLYLSAISKPKDAESWKKLDKAEALKNAGLSHSQAMTFLNILD